MIVSGREIAAVFQEATDWGAAIRVAFDGNAVELPKPREYTTVENQDFYPDDTFPDD